MIFDNVLRNKEEIEKEFKSLNTFRIFLMKFIEVESGL